MPEAVAPSARVMVCTNLITFCAAWVPHPEAIGIFTPSFHHWCYYPFLIVLLTILSIQLVVSLQEAIYVLTSERPKAARIIACLISTTVWQSIWDSMGKTLRVGYIRICQAC